MIHFLAVTLHPQNKIGALVQLVRMPACHAGGRWFESCTHRRRSLGFSEAFFVSPFLMVPHQYQGPTHHEQGLALAYINNHTSVL